MRLINTQSLELEEFYGTEIPKYAILSHTWRPREEVTFQEWLRNDVDTSTQTKSGFTKILDACRLARKDSFDWLWVDTNCIDKTSSAELSEAINSMYAWYRESSVCYAYLSDVSSPPEPNNYQKFLKEFSKSRWWTRGWTLQELLAPKQVIFFTQRWEIIGDRKSLASEINQISGISDIFLTGLVKPYTACASEKMSWLSLRETTRIEDMAYCMLGLFEINMPLLYGEGRKAFWRLQEEIVRVSNDHTIFCWTWTDSVPEDWVSMLAPWPDTFANSQAFGTTSTYKHTYNEAMPIPYSMTNVGLSIQLPVVHTFNSLFVFLDAKHPAWPMDTRACVHVKLIQDYKSGLRRCPFPRSPIMLPRDAVDRNDKLIIASRAPSYSGLSSNNPIQNYGILLFVSREILNSFRAPIAITSYCAVFDTRNSIFVLAPIMPTAQVGMWYLESSVDKRLSIYLFFAVVDVGLPNQRWHCSIALNEDIKNLCNERDRDESVDAHGQTWFQRKLQRVLRRYDEGEHDETVDVYGQVWFEKKLRRVVWQRGNGTMVSSTRNGLLKLGIGGNIEGRLRSAYLSSPERFVLPMYPVEHYHNDGNHVAA